MATNTDTSLLNIVRDRYLNAIVNIQRSSGPWRILVLDRQVKEHMNTVFKMYDILEHRIAQIEMIEEERNLTPSLEAIYIITPSRRNVERIINDFVPPSASSNSNPRSKHSSSKEKDKKSSSSSVAQPPQGPRYAAAHVFFIDQLPDPLFERLGNALGDHIKTLRELHVNYWPLEARGFSLKLPVNFFTLFAPSSPENTASVTVPPWKEELGFICQSIVDVLICLDEFPEIRYYVPPTSSIPTPLGPGEFVKQHATCELAFRVQDALERYARSNNGWPRQPEVPRPRGILLITDRTMDAVAPFLHEFSYQAMCNDLLPIEDGRKFKHSFKNANHETEHVDAILSDEDKVWVDIRHMHMKDALDRLILAFKQHQQSTQKGQNAGISGLQDMLADLPGLRESKEKLSLHLTLAEKCMELFESNRLNDIANVEQCCATGETAAGKTPKTLVEEMVPLLDNRSMSSTDKLRIIALYIMYKNGVPAEDKKRLYQHARLVLHEMDAVNNLSLLGQTVTKETSKKTKSLFKQPVIENAYDTSRYTPLVKLMLQDHLAGKLDLATFPYVRPPPPSATGRTNEPPPSSLRSARPRWQAGSKARASSEPRQRCLVFCLGGMTYSEMRTAYEVSNSSSKDVFIGSTEVLTAKLFIDKLSKLDNWTRPKLSEIPPPPTSRQPSSSSHSSRPPPPSSNHHHHATNKLQARPLVSPMPSASSVRTTDSQGTTGGSDEKKKKKGLFKRF